MSTRMFGQVLGRVTSEKCCNVIWRACDVCNHYNPLAFWVRQRSRNVHCFEVLEQRHRMKNHKYETVTCGASQLK